MTSSTDSTLAAEVPERAGRVLLELRSTSTTGSSNAKALGEEGDRAAHAAIFAILSRLCPADAILSEEGSDDQARLAAERVWIVDPLDGSREFSELGRASLMCVRSSCRLPREPPGIQYPAPADNITAPLYSFLAGDTDTDPMTPARTITRGRTAVVLVAAVALSVSVTGEAGAVTVGPRAVAFSGFSWSVKASTGLVGPGPNVFSDSPENVWVDAAGQLHLRITYRNGQWLAAEVVIDRSLGYGTYGFDLASPTGRLDPNVVLGLFTWSDDPAYSHREIDVEVARWGNAAAAQNAQYAVQPADRAGNLSRFVQPEAPATSHQFAWAPNRLSFASSSGTTTIAEWKYSGADVPKAGSERTRINLWLDHGRPPTDGAEVEVVLSRFSFTRR